MNIKFINEDLELITEAELDVIPRYGEKVQFTVTDLNGGTLVEMYESMGVTHIFDATRDSAFGSIEITKKEYYVILIKE